MFKPTTQKQTNKFQENHGKYISFLFGVEGIGNNKKEAEENLLKLMNKIVDQKSVK